MRFFSLAFFAAIAVCPSLAHGQNGSQAVQQAQPRGRGLAAIQQAGAAQKYLFVFFWRAQDAQTDQMWKSLQAAIAKTTDRATYTSLRVDDPTEKPLVDRYGIDRAPLPLVLALAPCGAVTKAFVGRLEENQLAAAFVSPCTERCMKALQDRKLVLLCVQNQGARIQPAVSQGVLDFKADQHYAAYTEVVCLNPGEAAEAGFLKDLQIDPRTPNLVTVLMSPPGSMVGRFDGPVTKEQLVAKLAAAQSGCCPGGKCGPGGCCPKH